MRRVHDALAERGAWNGSADGAGPRANFISVLCLAWPSGEYRMFEGRVFGTLVWPPRGGNGFGYDPMFVADGETLTFGEMEPAAKYAISHRTRAFEAFKRDCLMEATAKPVTKSGRDVEALTAAARSISTQVELVQFIANLRRDFSQHGREWQNRDLPKFLAALEAWLASSTLADEPRWRTLARALRCGERAQIESDPLNERDPGFGVYIHWPFCAQKCPYCDFNSHVRFGGWDEPRFLAAYKRELDHVASLTGPRTVSSIFFGGGTPSLMQASTVGAILDHIASHWSIDPKAEVTLEANPGSVEAERFQGYRDAGVNRVSIGVQSFRDGDLKRLGRIHSVEEAKAAIGIAARTFERFSFDLIYAQARSDGGASGERSCKKRWLSRATTCRSISSPSSRTRRSSNCIAAASSWFRRMRLRAISTR